MNTKEFKSRFYNPKSDKSQLLLFLKQTNDLSYIRSQIQQIAVHPLIQSSIARNLKRETYKDLDSGKRVPFSGLLLGEAAFYLYAIQENKENLNYFLNRKSAFDHELLLENYNEAEAILIQIEEKLGASIWLIENNLLLNEYRTGSEANWLRAGQITTNISSPLVVFLVESLSKRAERKVSYFRYINVISDQLNDIGSDTRLFEYLNFRLNQLGATTYSNFPYFLWLESTFPIIDRYLLIRDVLSMLCEEQYETQHNAVLEITKRIHKIIPNDPQLTQILATFLPKTIINIPNNQEINKFLRDYAIGNYQNCINNGKSLILKYPTSIECYELYIKSILEVKTNLEGRLCQRAIIDELINILYGTLSNHSDLDSTYNSAFKLCISFAAASWAKQLLSLIRSAASSSNGSKMFSKQYLINSSIRSPRLLYYVKPEDFSECTTVLNSDPNLREVTTTISNLINGDFEAINADENLYPDKKELYFGRALLRAGEYSMAEKHFLDLMASVGHSPIFYEEITVNLFRCLMKLNKLNDACSIFVNNYLQNRGKTKRLNKAGLLQKLESTNFAQEIEANLDFPIFYHIATNDTYLRYVAYDTYIESLSISRPSQLIEKIDHNQKLVYFLKEVCTIEVMHHSYHFEGTDDLEKERLVILHKLLVLDQENEDLYIREITELNQNFNIRKAIREVNKGRISVNIMQLRSNETDTIREAFSRYREIDKFSRTNKFIGVDSVEGLLENARRLLYDEVPDSKIVFSNDPAFIAFKFLFLEIRDKFLLSKEYGLDGYLSTRIRHGTLLNHIRSIFESRNIISQRDKDDNYQENEFWIQHIPHFLVEKTEKIQSSIKTFSRSIDEYTEWIVKELIQIRTEKHTKKSNALFDFSLSNNEIAQLYLAAKDSITDSNLFLSFVLDFLQDFTERLLSGIRSYINNVIKEHYSRILHDLNVQIKETIGSTPFPELTSSITICGTRIQDELRNISEWFYLSSSSKDLQLDIKVLIQTAVQITNAISPTFQINPRYIDNISIPVIGSVHIIYICRILLDNIIIHSKINPSDLEVEISYANISNDFLQISFRNNFSNEIDVDELRSHLQTVKNKWDLSSTDYENTDQEGGSGFDKIRRIIAFDLFCQNYALDFEIHNNNLTITLLIEFKNYSAYGTESQNPTD